MDRRYVLFHGKRHPIEMGAAEVSRFLTSPATEAKVAVSTQNQALNAPLFLYRVVLPSKTSREFREERSVMPTARSTGPPGSHALAAAGQCGRWTD